MQDARYMIQRGPFSIFGASVLPTVCGTLIEFPDSHDAGRDRPGLPVQVFGNCRQQVSRLLRRERPRLCGSVDRRGCRAFCLSPRTPGIQINVKSQTSVLIDTDGWLAAAKLPHFRLPVVVGVRLFMSCYGPRATSYDIGRRHGLWTVNSVLGSGDAVAGAGPGGRHRRIS